jgi:transcription antitermination factor NusG
MMMSAFIEVASLPHLMPVAADTHWYAAYTLPRHEKAVREQFNLRSVESYLPLFERPSRWKDRTVRLQLPLFPGYVFVRMPLAEKVRVLEAPGVVRLVGFSGQPAAIPDGEIEALQRSLALRRAEPHPYLATGKRVRIMSGPLEGLEGVILRRRNQLRIIVSVVSIQRSIALEVDAADLQPLS